MARLISNQSGEERVDLLVVGSGIAGLIAALTVAEQGGRVLVVSKGSLSASASYHAQGGIAAAGSQGDSPELHAADTIAAGRGLCRPSAVEVLVEEAPARIDDLRALGVRFSPELGLEGGHSRPRVFHSRGAETGREIELVLGRRVQEEDRIRVLEGERVLEIWLSRGRCVGVVGESGTLASSATLLATGGAGALWSRTTSASPPPTTSGTSSSWAPTASSTWRRATRTRPVRSGRGSLWPTEPEPRSPTSSSCNSTRPRCPRAGCS